MFLRIQIMANDFQKLVFKTVQEVGANLYIMMFGFPPFKPIWQKNDPDTLLLQHRVKKEHHLIMPWAKNKGQVVQWNPGFFLHLLM